MDLYSERGVTYTYVYVFMKILKLIKVGFEEISSGCSRNVIKFGSLQEKRGLENEIVVGLIWSARNLKNLRSVCLCVWQILYKFVIFFVERESLRE